MEALDGRQQLSLKSTCGPRSTSMLDTATIFREKDVDATKAEYIVGPIRNFNPHCRLTSALIGPSASLLNV